MKVIELAHALHQAINDGLAECELTVEFHFLDTEKYENMKPMEIHVENFIWTTTNRGIYEKQSAVIIAN